MTRQNFRTPFSIGAALLLALSLLTPAIAQESSKGKGAPGTGFGPESAEQETPAGDQAATETQLDPMAEKLLDSVHRFRLRNFMALNNYYNYTADPDQELASRITDNMDQSRQLLGKIESQSGESLSDSQLNELKKTYENFAKQMDTNIEDVRSSGYPDLRLLSDMANQAQTLSKLSGKIYRKVAGQESTPTQTNLELAREAAITMAVMVTRYSARSSSSVAQVFQGADMEKSLDELSKDFENNLEKLRARLGNDQQIATTLSDVNNKWRFIRGSYINYDEENVAFVINRYSNSIIQGLEKTIERLKSA
ncbi:hypothetical protein ACMDCT_03630 [Halomonadaceae bacterium KBTZ08]